MKGKWTLLVEDVPNYSISLRRMTNVTLNSFFNYYSPKPGDVLVELGAGVGNDVFIMNHHFGANFGIHALEAHPKTFDKLCLLVNRNSFKNANCHDIAIAEKNGDIFIADTDNHSANQINSENKGEKVTGLTMDSFVKKHNINKIDYIKINIEGAEKGALQGMGETLGIISNIVVACHDKLAPYYNNNPFFYTKDFVRGTLLEHNFMILDEIESDYHNTIYAKKRNG